MSPKQTTRSKLMIDAVVQAAAGSAPALSPLKKLDTIAGLAGFVLRLFRSRTSLPPGNLPAVRNLRRVQHGSSKAVREQSGRSVKGGTRHG